MSKSKLKKSYEKLAEAGIPCEMVGNALLVNGDSRKVLKLLPANFVSAAVLDPMYGVSTKNGQNNFDPETVREGIERRNDCRISPAMFSGRVDISRRGEIRYQHLCYEWATQLWSVLKPGAFLTSFCSPRLYHRLACAISDANYIIKDQLQWLFGQGFAKSHNVSIGIDKLAGAKRRIVGPNPNRKGRKNWDTNPKNITLPATKEAIYWDGWGTGLKPSNEPIVLAQKPCSEKSIARNVLRHETGCININDCRIGERKTFPTNTLIDEEVAELLGDKARFFYSGKVTKREKHAGCEHLPKKNNHSTVKPISIMEYLVKLVTPKNGVCLDIFMGSGSTGISCANLGFDFIGVEREAEFFEIAKARIRHWQNIKKAA